MEPEEPKCACLKKPKNIIFIMNILMDLVVLGYMIYLIVTMTDKFFMDIWLGWTIFTIILFVIWIIAVVIQFLGKTTLFDVTRGLYKGFLFCSWGIVLAVMLGYSVTLRGRSFDLLKACDENLLKYFDDAPDDFSTPQGLAKWIDDRAYYAGQNTLIIFLLWHIFSLVYILDIFCCTPKSDFNYTA